MAHHDLAPELFLTRFSQKGWPYKLLIAFEGFCCKLADVVIETNESYRQVDIGRHKIDPAKTFIVRNDPVLAEWQGQTDVGDKKGRDLRFFMWAVSIHRTEWKSWWKHFMAWEISAAGILRAPSSAMAILLLISRGWLRSPGLMVL